jgi:pseudoazurin
MRRVVVTCAALVMGMTAVAQAAEHEVQMLNKGPDGQRNWFEPAVTAAEPGDVIKFVAVDKGHNSASLEIPEGTEEWKGKISKEVDVTVETPGVYAYKCTPHLGLGMVGFLVVGGSLDNIDAAEAARYPGKSKQIAADLIAEIKASN